LDIDYLGGDLRLAISDPEQSPRWSVDEIAANVIKERGYLMNIPTNEPGNINRFLNDIELGMEVYDREGKRLGLVEHIYRGDANQDATGIDEGLEELVQENLVDQGFIRVGDANLLEADILYVRADQIASVARDGVHLNVIRDDI
jgi:hypothetical protein